MSVGNHPALEDVYRRATALIHMAHLLYFLWLFSIEERAFLAECRDFLIEYGRFISVGTCRRASQIFL